MEALLVEGLPKSKKMGIYMWFNREKNKVFLLKSPGMVDSGRFFFLAHHRSFGDGIGSFNSFAVSIHRSIKKVRYNS